MRGYFRIDLANNCNIRCIMCQAYNSLPVSAMTFLDFDGFVTATRGELSKWAYVQLGNVAEATIHPRFADFLRYVRREAPDTTIHIVTNGKLLTRFSSLINDLGNCLVQISMDSVRKDTHEYIREGSGFDRAIESIAGLDLNRTRVLLSFTLMKSNISEYHEMVRFCSERGYQMSAFPMIVRTEAGVLPMNLLHESLWFDMSNLRAWLQDFYGKTYGLMVGTASGAIPATIDFACNAHHDDLNMDATGMLNLCGKLALGSMPQRDLRTLWHTDEAEEFRRQVDDSRAPCMTCDYRQRCLSPSMSILDNHFNEELAGAISPETRHAIRYDREISDEEARWLFVKDIGPRVGIFDIAGKAKEWTARPVTAGTVAGHYELGDTLAADSRHVLHDAMRRRADSELHTQFLEAYGPYNLVKYHRKYWALPMSLGVLNITRETDRQKPGILVSDSLSALKLSCGEGGRHEPPRLLETFGAYNLVGYAGKFWAIPLSFGPCDVTQTETHSREGVHTAETLADLRTMLDDSEPPGRLWRLGTNWMSRS